MDNCPLCQIGGVKCPDLCPLRDDFPEKNDEFLNLLKIYGEDGLHYASSCRLVPEMKENSIALIDEMRQLDSEIQNCIKRVCISRSELRVAKMRMKNFAEANMKVFKHITGHIKQRGKEPGQKRGKEPAGAEGSPSHRVTAGAEEEAVRSLLLRKTAGAEKEAVGSLSLRVRETAGAEEEAEGSPPQGEVARAEEEAEGAVPYKKRRLG